MSIDNGGDLAMMDFDLSQSTAPVQCPLCSEMFVVEPDSQPLRGHLLNMHKLIIAEIDEIADLRQYLMYWGKLRTGNLLSYCSAVLTNTEKDARQGKQEVYFLLSHHLPEDKRLRDMLRDIKLKSVTRAKELERADTSFSRKCVYCYEIVGGGLHNIFAHLTNRHSFNIGNPDNIIFGAKLLDAIEEKFKNLQCLYCEKTFAHHEVMRIHMRKKGHRTLNPNNRFYDQFYLINYLEPGTPWQEVKSQKDDDTSPHAGSGINLDGVGSEHYTSSFDEAWTDWRDEDIKASTCLFCPYTTSNVPAGLLQHMTTAHSFDMAEVTRDFSFYDKVKAVNYIRSKVLEFQCPVCRVTYSNSAELQQHLSNTSHCKLPTPALWCTPRYLIPVQQEDGLLYHLEDPPEDDHAAQSECEVYCEEIPTVSLPPELAQELSTDSCHTDAVVHCLFCRHSIRGSTVVHDIICHMHNMHAFDLYQVMRSLDFYQQVKLINYIRAMTQLSACYYCGQRYSDPRTLEEHRTMSGHTEVPDHALFVDDKYLSPMWPEDPLLQGLQEESWTDDSDLEDDVVPPHIILKKKKNKEKQWQATEQDIARQQSATDALTNTNTLNVMNGSPDRTNSNLFGDGSDMPQLTEDSVSSWRQPHGRYNVSHLQYGNTLQEQRHNGQEYYRPPQARQNYQQHNRHQQPLKEMGQWQRPQQNKNSHRRPLRQQNQGNANYNRHTNNFQQQNTKNTQPLNMWSQQSSRCIPNKREQQLRVLDPGDAGVDATALQLQQLCTQVLHLNSQKQQY